MRALLEKLLAPVISFLIANFLRLSFATTRWRASGAQEMYDLVERGAPVIIVCWHQRLMYAPVSWDRNRGEACTLRSMSQAGRISGGVQRRLGFISIAMDEDQPNFNASRKIAKLMKSGVSLGITADGPEGPPRVLKTAVLEWARLTGAPIFMFSFSTKSHWNWKTWDRLMFPLPFTKGVLVHEKWDGQVSRKLTDEQMETLRQKLEEDLNNLTARTDQLVDKEDLF